MKNLSFIVAILCCLDICNAQNYTPIELCKLVLSKDSLPNISKHFADEFLGHPNGRDFPPDVKVFFELLLQTENKAVISKKIASGKLQHSDH